MIFFCLVLYIVSHTSCRTFEPAGLKSGRNDYAQRSGPAHPVVRRHSTSMLLLHLIMVNCDMPFSKAEIDYAIVYLSRGREGFDRLLGLDVLFSSGSREISDQK